MRNLKTRIETRYEIAREMLRWQLNPNRVMTADEVDDHLDRLNPDLTVAAPLDKEASKPAAPSVTQDEIARIRYGALRDAENICRLFDLGTPDGHAIADDIRKLAEAERARAASPSANVAQGAEVVALRKELYMDQSIGDEAQRAYRSAFNHGIDAALSAIIGALGSERKAARRSMVEREQFEVWADEKLGIATGPTIHWTREIAWEAWQASRRSALEEAIRTAENAPLESFASDSYIRQTMRNREQIVAALRVLANGGE